MKLFRFEANQFIQAPLDDVWAFFSDPRNLQTITPPAMGFEILTPLPEKVSAGLIIEYRVSPLWNFPMRWVTEITHVKEPEYFVDEQRFGPYRFWHHFHKFTRAPNGVFMQDVVHYMLPVPLVDRLVNRIVVRPRVQEIFAYRQRKIEEIFH